MTITRERNLIILWQLQENGELHRGTYQYQDTELLRTQDGFFVSETETDCNCNNASLTSQGFSY